MYLYRMICPKIETARQKCRALYSHISEENPAYRVGKSWTAAHIALHLRRNFLYSRFDHSRQFQQIHRARDRAALGLLHK